MRKYERSVGQTLPLLLQLIRERERERERVAKGA